MVSRTLVGILLLIRSAGGADAFVVKPYLQMGESKHSSNAGRLVVVWHTPDQDSRWDVQIKEASGPGWVHAKAPQAERVAVAGVEPHRVYRADLQRLSPGAEFTYRVLRNGTPVFEALAKARKPAGSPYRFVLFGDCGSDTPEQRAVAYQTYLARPDMVFIVGDIVYSRGRISEYRTKFFPIYNADTPSASTGVPLLRSTLFVAAPGNHDTAVGEMDAFPDGLGYFHYWRQPLNGPVTDAHGPNTTILMGSTAHRQNFLDAASKRFPRMANFSFDYGDTHWTVLDSNVVVDWTMTGLRKWVEDDLRSARNAAWRIVAFHHPPFRTPTFGEHQMRVLADVFEKGKVDVIFSGHDHNYQRSFPLRFQAKAGPNGRLVQRDGHVRGQWTLDKTFDGRTHTKPNGIIYVVSGGGGGRLYDGDYDGVPSRWEEYTAKLVSLVHSLSLVDVTADRLTIRQLSKDGAEFDRFTITR